MSKILKVTFFSILGKVSQFLIPYKMRLQKTSQLSIQLRTDHFCNFLFENTSKTARFETARFSRYFLIFFANLLLPGPPSLSALPLAKRRDCAPTCARFLRRKFARAQQIFARIGARLRVFFARVCSQNAAIARQQWIPDKSVNPVVFYIFKYRLKVIKIA